MDSLLTSDFEKDGSHFEVGLVGYFCATLVRSVVRRVDVEDAQTARLVAVFYVALW